MKIHEKYIKRCIQLARNGLGRTYPNPFVGSVIVHDNRIIGEGWHRKFGEAHAEVNAVNSVKETSLLPKSTIYVSLEPCNHFGKTPPCTDLILDRGIKKVVIGTVDPFSEVSGRGIKKLLDAGCEVIVGVLEDECQELNRRFFTFHTKKRPYIVLKWAQSEDKFLAPELLEGDDRAPVWITNQYSRQLVHKWRSEEISILVGTNTAIKDNPQLNVRSWTGADPVRLVLDRKRRIPEASHLFDGSVKTIVFTENPPAENPSKNIIFEAIDFEGGLPEQICEILYRHNLQSVIVEGGRQTLQSFLDADLWDEARIFTGKVQLKNGVRAPEISGELIRESSIAGDLLKIYKHD